MLLVTFQNILGSLLRDCCPYVIPELEDCPLSAVRDHLSSTFVFCLPYLEAVSSISNQVTRHFRVSTEPLYM
jgi:hypothetical protein